MDSEQQDRSQKFMDDLAKLLQKHDPHPLTVVKAFIHICNEICRLQPTPENSDFARTAIANTFLRQFSLFNGENKHFSKDMDNTSGRVDGVSYGGEITSQNYNDNLS